MSFTSNPSAPALTPEQEMYLKLGDFIWDGIPYPYAPDHKGAISTDEISNLTVTGQLRADRDGTPRTSIDGPAKDFGGEGRPKLAKGEPVSVLPDDGSVLPVTEESIRAQPSLSLWWPFGGKQYRVTKALMIPYTVTDPDTGLPSQRHFLIGYMGVDSHGG
jgi:hypothetical protein